MAVLAKTEINFSISDATVLLNGRVPTVKLMCLVDQTLVKTTLPLVKMFFLKITNRLLTINVLATGLLTIIQLLYS